MNSLFNLKDKVALVTGSTRGIGYAIAYRMAQAGAQVIISSENVEECKTVANKFIDEGLCATPLSADLNIESEINKLTNDVLKTFKRLDILVCCAGIAPHYGPMHTITSTDWKLTMDVNLYSAHVLTSAFTSCMKINGGGSVIYISSLAAMRGNKEIGLYALSKAALAQMARNLAVEWGPSNIRFNAIAPGLIDTDLTKIFHDNPTLYQERMRKTPLRRIGTTDEISGVALLLASPAGAFITGQTIVVDGGTLITDGN